MRNKHAHSQNTECATRAERTCSCWTVSGSPLPAVCIELRNSMFNAACSSARTKHQQSLQRLQVQHASTKPQIYMNERATASVWQRAKASGAEQQAIRIVQSTTTRFIEATKARGANGRSKKQAHNQKEFNISNKTTAIDMAAFAAHLVFIDRRSVRVLNRRRIRRIACNS